MFPKPLDLSAQSLYSGAIPRTHVLKGHPDMREMRRFEQEFVELPEEEQQAILAFIYAFLFRHRNVQDSGQGGKLDGELRPKLRKHGGRE